jgi:hypothetical protein
VCETVRDPHLKLKALLLQRGGAGRARHGPGNDVEGDERARNTAIIIIIKLFAGRFPDSLIDERPAIKLFSPGEETIQQNNIKDTITSVILNI